MRQDTAALAAEFAAVDYFGVVIKPSAQRCSLDTARARTSLHISLTASAYPIGKKLVRELEVSVNRQLQPCHRIPNWGERTCIALTRASVTKLRTVMSSIMRARSGLMCFSQPLDPQARMLQSRVGAADPTYGRPQCRAPDWRKARLFPSTGLSSWAIQHLRQLPG